MMDKSWIDLPNRMSREYINGIDQFLVFAYTNRVEGSMISCPCRKCENRYHLVREGVREHLILNGFLKKYKHWINHGESYVSLHGNRENETLANLDIGDDMVGMIQGAMGNPHAGISVEGNEPQGLDPHASEPQLGPNAETAKYFKLLQDAQSELYPGCQKFTSLSFIVRLLHLKVLNQWTDKSVDMLLELLNEAFPLGVKLPDSYYKAQKVTTDLGFTYETWDACPNSYHGYCRTYRRTVPRRAVYKHGAGPSQSAPQPSTIVQITQQVRAELRNELREELRAEFSTHLQQLRAEMMAFVSQGASVDPNRQAPDASSGHRAFRESAEDENLYTPPPEDQIFPE